MLILALDDEEILLESLTEAIRAAEPGAEIRSYVNAFDALADIAQDSLRPDVVFSDIEMPGMSGLELAKRFNELVPQANLVFVTGFAQYALEAITLRVSGYVIKPVSPQKIRVELDNLRKPVGWARGHMIRVKCFGNFEIFADDRPLRFRYAKTKELLAYLVDRQGAALSTAQLCAVLWEDAEDSPALHSQFRNLISDLSRTLAASGGGDVLCRSFNRYSVDTSAFDCDLFAFLRQEPAAVSAYSGEYMSQYSWAEYRLASLGKE